MRFSAVEGRMAWDARRLWTVGIRWDEECMVGKIRIIYI
jgi:hypothetical protein